MAPSVHLVGSIGLDTVEEVFTTVGALLGPYLRRVPDGEPGGRRLWSQWQVPVLRAHPCLQQVRRDLGALATPLTLAEGVSADELRFGELGYAREARASYVDFSEARQRGDLPASTRFQVSLPTPWAIVRGPIAPEAFEVVLAAYEQAMLREVVTLCDRIPHVELAIQWDIAKEMTQWDGQLEHVRPFDGMDRVIGRAFGRLAEAIPPDVELGFHLCYGDLDGRHSIQPKDATKLVEMAQLIVASVQRPISFIHLPVPIERCDDAYFEPLRDLRLSPRTELYLGLVHAKDGLAGTLRRAETAQKFVQAFGIASECGIARSRTRDITLEFLRIYAAAARALA